MANLKTGILGPPQEQVGPVTVYQRKNKVILRKAKNAGHRQSTVKQLAQQMKFILAKEFTHQITKFIMVGYGLQAEISDGSANNLARSKQMKEAIEGQYPDLYIDRSKVKVTSGTLTVSADVNIYQKYFIHYTIFGYSVRLYMESVNLEKRE